MTVVLKHQKEQEQQRKVLSASDDSFVHITCIVFVFVLFFVFALFCLELEKYK